MLPVSGAEQLKTMDEARLRPMTSQSIPYSQLVSPTPISSSGMKRFHRPSAFAFSRSCDELVGVGLVTADVDLLVERLDQLALARVVVLVEKAVYALEQSSVTRSEGVKSKAREAITASARARRS